MKNFILLSILTLNPLANANVELIYEAKEKNIQLDLEDKEILRMGEISDSRYIIGGILGTYPLGLGIGHAIQGTWSHKGWIFTVGQLSSAGVVVVGLLNSECSVSECTADSTLIQLGLISLAGFKIWEIIDLWTGVPKYNRQYKRLKSLIEEKGDKPELTFAPIFSPRLGTGLGMRISF